MEQAIESVKSELRSHVLATAMTEISSFQKYVSESCQVLMDKEDNMIKVLNQLMEDEFKEAKAQEARFEKARIALDTAIAELAALKKSKKVKPEEITSSENKKENLQSSFQLCGQDTYQSLDEINAIAECVVMEQLCDFLDAYRDHYQAISRYLNEIVPSLYKFRRYVEEAKERRETAFNIDTSLIHSISPFGEHINDTLARQNKEIPAIVQATVDWLYENALEITGLFRVIPDLQDVSSFKNEVLKDPDNVVIPSNADPHIVATILKMYLRELPEPLLPTHIYAPLIDTVNCKVTSQRIEATCLILDEIPDGNYQSLRLIIWLLHCLVLCQDINKLTSGSLATSFTPLLLKQGEDNEGDLFEPRAVIEFIIQNYDDIFPEEEEEGE